MLSTNDVYRKIKEISKRSANPRPNVAIQSLASELMTARETILPILTDLKDMRLIAFDKPTPIEVKLTLLGTTVNR